MGGNIATIPVDFSAADISAIINEQFFKPAAKAGAAATEFFAKTRGAVGTGVDALEEVFTLTAGSVVRFGLSDFSVVEYRGRMCYRGESGDLYVQNAHGCLSRIYLAHPEDNYD